MPKLRLCVRFIYNFLWLAFQIACPENNKGVKWNKTREDYCFLNARKGDMLCCPIQCDYCWHVNLTHGSARDVYAGDARLLGYICRVKCRYDVEY